MNSTGLESEPLGADIPVLGMRSLNERGFQSTFITPAVIAVLTVLTAGFIIVSYCHVIGHYCNLLGRLMSRSRPGGLISDVESGRFFSRKAGEYEELVKTLPICIFKTQKESNEDCIECVICLSAFKDSDKLRLLPKCNHAFHVHCIDTWLQSHYSCPLCRSPISTQAFAPPVCRSLPYIRRWSLQGAPFSLDAHTANSQASAGQESDSTREVENSFSTSTQIENPGSQVQAEEETRTSSVSAYGHLPLSNYINRDKEHGDERELLREKHCFRRVQHPVFNLRRSKSAGSCDDWDSSLNQEISKSGDNMSSSSMVNGFPSFVYGFEEGQSSLTMTTSFPLSSSSIEGFGRHSSSIGCLCSVNQSIFSSRETPEEDTDLKPIGVESNLKPERRFVVEDQLASNSRILMKRSFSGGKLLQFLQSDKRSFS